MLVLAEHHVFILIFLGNNQQKLRQPARVYGKGEQHFEAAGVRGGIRLCFTSVAASFA